MAYEFLGCCGFEMKDQTIFDSTQPATDAGFTPESAGSWSRYAYNPDQGGDSRQSYRTATRDWVAFNYYPGTGTPIFAEYNDEGTPLSYLTRNGGSGVIDWHQQTSAGTIIASSSEVLTTAVWHSFNIYATYTEGGGGRVIVYVDDELWIDFTGATLPSSFPDTESTDPFGFFLDDVGSAYGVDDMIWGTGGEADYPGFPKVHGGYPNADGTTTELVKTPASATRWYLPSSDGVQYEEPNPAAVSPAYDSVWNQTSLAVRHRLHPAKGQSEYYDGGAITGTSLTATDSFAYSGVSAQDDLLWYQYVSPPLASQTLSPGGAWTLKGQIRVQESLGTDNERIQIVVRVVSEDGTSVTGTLYAGDTDTTNPPSSEFSSTSPTNRVIPRQAISPVALTQVVAAAGDRLVVEIGTRHMSANAASDCTVIVGEESAADLTDDDESSTAANAAWIEFSSAITLHATKGNYEYLSAGPSEDNTLIGETTAGELDSYGFENTSLSSVTVVGVRHWCHAYRSADGPGQLRLYHLRAGNDSFGATEGLGASVAVQVVRDMPEDPSNTVAWTTTNVNASEFGAEVN